MSEWKEVKIGDVCSIKHGFAFKSKFFKDEKSTYVITTPGNFHIGGGFKMADKPKFYDGPIPQDYVLHKNDLIVTMTDLSKGGDTLGYGAFVPALEGFTFLHNQRIGLVQYINTDVVEKEFLYWLMRTRHYQKFVVNHSSGSTVKHSSPSLIGKYTFKCPIIPTQRRIAAILSSLDAKIENNNKVNAKLEEIAQNLFKEWFVDFGPFKDSKFVDSELGPIPEGWRVGFFSKTVDVMPGGTPKTDVEEYWLNGEIPFFSPKDAGSDVYCVTTEKAITTSGLNACSSRLYPKNTIFITARGTVGKVVMAASDMAMNQSNYAVKPKDGCNYYYTFLQTLSITEKLKHKSNGAVFSAIVTRDFDENIVIPEKCIEDQFNMLVAPIFSNIWSNLQENQRLATLRDTLLPKLMSGEIEV